MALNNITRALESLGDKASSITDEDLKETLTSLNSKFPSIKHYADVPEEDFSRCIRRIFETKEIEYPLDEEQEREIRRQLQVNSVDGNIEEDIFVDLWKYWLRKNTRNVKVFIVVDVQNDFISGSLAIPQAAEIIPVINGIFEKFSSKFELTVYTQDWHPSDHISFFENLASWPLHESFQDQQDSIKMRDKVLFQFEDNPTPYPQQLWPKHCVPNTWGAELHKDLRQPEASDIILQKGNDSNRDHYSALWCNDHSRRTNLFNQLLHHNVTDVYVCGLALDYCVDFTAEDLALQGFKTYLIEDGCRPVSCSGGETTVKKLKGLNVESVQSAQLADIL